jgi:hypothetical protein
MSSILKGCRMPHVCSTALLITVIMLTGCAPMSDTQRNMATGEPFPDSVNAFGDGFPYAGAPCRRLGESSATSAYLDHTQTLAGCLSLSDAEALGGRIVGRIDGVWLVSIPTKP